MQRICPKCGGDLLVYSTKIVGSVRYRYLRCDACGYLPASKEIVPLEYAPQKRKLTIRRMTGRRGNNR